jgi:hypothetical protein
LRSTPGEVTVAVSDVRRLKLYEQARAHWGEETAEVLMEVVVPAGQDMATKADLDAADFSMKGHTFRTLLIALAPLHLGILGLYSTG